MVIYFEGLKYANCNSTGTAVKAHAVSCLAPRNNSIPMLKFAEKTVFVMILLSSLPACVTDGAQSGQSLIIHIVVFSLSYLLRNL